MFLQTYKRALEVILKKPIMLWGLSLLLGIVSVVGSAVTVSIPFLSIAVGYLFTCGAVKLYMDGLAGKEVNSKQLFFAFNKNCVKTAGAMAWRDLWTVIWSMVPIAGIVKTYSYKFVPYIITTHPEVSAFDALKLSIKLTNGKKLQMWLADLVFVAAPVVAILILFLLGLIPILGYIFKVALAAVIFAVVLFGTIFSGLYQAAFFDEAELVKLLEEEAEAEAPVVVE